MWLPLAMNMLASELRISQSPTPPPQLDRIMVLGFFSSFVTIVCYFHRRQSRAFALGLAIGLAAMAVYAFLQAAWPVGFAEGIWSGAAFVRCYQWKKTIKRRSRELVEPVESRSGFVEMESRISRMFGRN
jgi:hypothetical protein